MTHSPTDEVLAQLGSRVQHQLAVVDRELLAAKLEAGTAKRAAEKEAAEQARADTKGSSSSGSSGSSSRRRTTKNDDGSIVEHVAKSGAFMQFMRTAAAEIARGMFGTGRR